MTLEICSVILHNICVGGLIYTYIYMRNSAHIMVVTTPTDTNKDKNTKKIIFKCIIITGVWELVVSVPIVGTSIECTES